MYPSSSPAWPLSDTPWRSLACTTRPQQQPQPRPAHHPTPTPPPAAASAVAHRKPFRPAGGQTPATKNNNPLHASSSRRPSRISSFVGSSGRRVQRAPGAPDFHRLEKETDEYIAQINRQQQQQQTSRPYQQPYQEQALQALPTINTHFQDQPTSWAASAPDWSQTPTPYGAAPFHAHPPPPLHPSPPSSVPPSVPVMASSWSAAGIPAQPYGHTAQHTHGYTGGIGRPASAPPNRPEYTLAHHADGSVNNSNRPSAVDLLAHQRSSHAQLHPPHAPITSAADEKENYSAGLAVPSPVPVSRHESLYSSLLRQTPPAAATRQDDVWSAAYMERLSAKHEMGLSEAMFFAKSSQVLSNQVAGNPGSMYSTATRIHRRKGWWQPEPPIATLTPTTTNNQTAGATPNGDSSHGSIAWINPTPLPSSLKAAAESKEARREFKPSESFFGTGVWAHRSPNTHAHIDPHHALPAGPHHPSQSTSTPHAAHIPPHHTPHATHAHAHAPFEPPANAPTQLFHALLAHFSNGSSSLYPMAASADMVGSLVDSCLSALGVRGSSGSNGGVKEVMAILWSLEAGVAASTISPPHSWPHLVDLIVGAIEDQRWEQHTQRRALAQRIDEDTPPHIHAILQGQQPTRDMLEQLLKYGSSFPDDRAEQVMFHLHRLSETRQPPIESLEHLYHSLFLMQSHTLQTLRDVTSWLHASRIFSLAMPRGQPAIREVARLYFADAAEQAESNNPESMQQILVNMERAIIDEQAKPCASMADLVSRFHFLRTGAASPSPPVHRPRTPSRPRVDILSPRGDPIMLMSARPSPAHAYTPMIPAMLQAYLPQPGTPHDAIGNQTPNARVRVEDQNEEEDEDEDAGSPFKRAPSATRTAPLDMAPLHPARSGVSDDSPAHQPREPSASAAEPASSTASHDSSIPAVRPLVAPNRLVDCIPERESTSRQGMSYLSSDSDDDADREREIRARRALQAKWAAAEAGGPQNANNQRTKKEKTSTSTKQGVSDGVPASSTSIVAPTPLPPSAPVRASSGSSVASSPILRSSSGSPGPANRAIARSAGESVVRFADETKETEDRQKIPTTTNNDTNQIKQTPDEAGPGSPTTPAVTNPVPDASVPAVSSVVAQPVIPAGSSPVSGPLPAGVATASASAPSSAAAGVDSLPGHSPSSELPVIHEVSEKTEERDTTIDTSTKPTHTNAQQQNTPLPDPPITHAADTVTPVLDAAASPSPAIAGDASIPAASEPAKELGTPTATTVSNSLTSPPTDIQPSVTSTMTLLPLARSPAPLHPGSGGTPRRSLDGIPNLLLSRSISSPVSNSLSLSAAASKPVTPIRLSIVGQPGTSLLNPTNAPATPTTQTNATAPGTSQPNTNTQPTPTPQPAATVAATPAPPPVPSPSSSVFDEESACDLCCARVASVQCDECDLKLCVGPAGTLGGCDLDVHKALTRSKHKRVPWSIELEREMEAAAAKATIVPLPLSVPNSTTNSRRSTGVTIPPLQLAGLATPDRRVGGTPLMTAPASTVASRRPSVQLGLSLGVSPIASLSTSPLATPVHASRPLSALALITPPPNHPNNAPASGNPSGDGAHKNAPPPLCDICDEEVSTVHCPQCFLHLCDEDDKQIHKPVSKQTHVRVPV